MLPEACLFLAYDRDDGSALLAPLGPAEPILGHVRGEVVSVSTEAIEIRIAGALVAGIGGSGDAVHGQLRWPSPTRPRSCGPRRSTSALPA